jgi:hypothetical protein
MPRRIKVRGNLFHGQVPEGAVYVGRAAPGLKRSPFCNPYAVKAHGLDKALALYAEHIKPMIAGIRAELAGKDLACWCPLDRPCHADMLLHVANEDPDKQPDARETDLG